MKDYLVGRMQSMTAWIGAILFVAELLLHMGSVSTLMLVLAVVLVVVPEDSVRSTFANWTRRVNEWLGADE